MHNHRPSALIFTLLVLIAVTGGAHTAPPNSATNERMRGIVKQVVEDTGSDIIGLGSWISSKKYADPLTGGKSDHDMRLLLPRGTKPEVAAEEWNRVRKELTAKIRKEFGKDADTVLKTVNLYPPTQLMEGVEDTDDAVKAFKSGSRCRPSATPMR